MLSGSANSSIETSNGPIGLNVSYDLAIAELAERFSRLLGAIGDVLASRHPGEMLPGGGRVDVAGSASDDGDDLGLVVDRLPVGGDLDRRRRPAHRSRRLGEQHRLRPERFGRLSAACSSVVEGDREDRARSWHRRTQLARCERDELVSHIDRPSSRNRRVVVDGQVDGRVGARSSAAGGRDVEDRDRPARSTLDRRGWRTSRLASRHRWPRRTATDRATAISSANPLKSGLTQAAAPASVSPLTINANEVDGDDRAQHVEPPGLDARRSEEDRRERDEGVAGAGLGTDAAVLDGDHDARDAGAETGDRQRDDAQSGHVEADQSGGALVAAECLEVAAERRVVEDEVHDEGDDGEVPDDLGNAEPVSS